MTIIKKNIKECNCLNVNDLQQILLAISWFENFPFISI